MRIRAMVMGFLVLLFVAGTARPQTGGGYNLTWSTVDSGGGASSGGGYTLNGTVGQAEAGEQSGGNYQLYGGYWYPGIRVLVSATASLALAGLALLVLGLAKRGLRSVRFDSSTRRECTS